MLGVLGSLIKLGDQDAPKLDYKLFELSTVCSSNSSISGAIDNMPFQLNCSTNTAETVCCAFKCEILIRLAVNWFDANPSTNVVTSYFITKTIDYQLLNCMIQQPVALNFHFQDVAE